MRRPRVCSGDPSKRQSANAPYGTTTATAIIQHGLDLVASYIEEYFHNIWFLTMLEQFLKYSYENKGKFDIVAACQMAEIADEELSELAPVIQKTVSQEFQDIGYYIDENGYRQYGIIPNNRQQQARFSWDNYDGKNIISDERYR